MNNNNALEEKERATQSSRRKYISSMLAVTGALALAGCTSDDTEQPELVTDETDEQAGGSTETTTGQGGEQTETSTDGSDESTETAEETGPETAQAALGDVVEGDRLALVAYDVERTTEMGEFVTADAGNEFIVVDIAAKNKSENEYISFSSFLQTTLRDSESYEYDQTITGSDNALSSGELVPGEVTRGVVVFEIPEGSSGLSLRVDFDESIFDYDGAQIDLESEGSGRTLTQDIQIEVYQIGDTLEHQDTRFTPNEVTTSMGDDYTSPDSGNEFLVVDITVENTSSEELSVSTLLQMALKDNQGRTYNTSIEALVTLDRGFSQGQPIPPNSERRGEIAFEVEQGLSPLYLMMDFDFFTEGDKSFFQLR